MSKAVRMEVVGGAKVEVQEGSVNSEGSGKGGSEGEGGWNKCEGDDDG